MPPFAITFTDNLVGNCWSTYAIGSATVAETSGQFRATLPSSTAGTHEAGYQSTSQYDLTSDSFYINIETMVATGVAAYAFFDIRPDVSSGSNVIRWVQQSNTLKAQSIIAGVTTDRYSVTWSSTTYKYLRIRADTTTVYWDSSSNGTSWTNRATLAISSLFAVTTLSLVIGAGCGNVASPGSFRLDDVNLILPALTTNWRWTQARWPLTNRHRTITLALDTAGTAQAYIVTADDVDVSDNPTGNVRYWSGPADGGRELTEQTTQAAAQDMAVNIPTDGRFDLPEQIDARVFRVYHRSIDGNAYTIRELYPRRLIQADDVDAEIIRGLVISGHQLICDELSALSANVGVLTAGVIDGVTIYAGGSGHPVTLDVAGIRVLAGTGYDNKAAYRMVNSGGVEIGTLFGDSASGANVTLRGSLDSGSGGGAVNIYGSGTSSQAGTVFLQALNPSANASITLNVSSGGVDTIIIDATATTIGSATTDSTTVKGGLNVGTTGSGAANGDIVATGGLNVGTATGAGAGEVLTSGGIAISMAGGSKNFLTVTDTSPSSDILLKLYDSSNTIGSGSYFIRALKGSTDQFWVKGDASAWIGNFLEMPEVSAPAAGAANTARLFTRDNGSGKTQLCVIFNTGAIQVLATQP